MDNLHEYQDVTIDEVRSYYSNLVITEETNKFGAIK